MPKGRWNGRTARHLRQHVSQGNDRARDTTCRDPLPRPMSRLPQSLAVQVLPSASHYLRLMRSEDVTTTRPLPSLREDLTDYLQRYGITPIPAIKVTGYEATARLDDLTVALQQRFVPETERVLTVRSTCPDCWLDVSSMAITSKQEFLEALARPFSTHICRGQARDGGR